MSQNLKSFLIGLPIGLGPIVVCAALFYGAPLLVDGNPGALLSFGLMGLFFLSSIGVFIVSIIFLIKKQTVIGATALISQLVIWATALAFLNSY